MTTYKRGSETMTDYKRWCEMSDDEARREMERLETWDEIYEAFFMLGSCVLVGTLIWLGIWLWN